MYVEDRLIQSRSKSKSRPLPTPTPPHPIAERKADIAVTEMSTRIDNLENTVQDLIQGDIDGGIGTPSPAIPSGRRG